MKLPQCLSTGISTRSTLLREWIVGRLGCGWQNVLFLLLFRNKVGLQHKMILSKRITWRIFIWPQVKPDLWLLQGSFLNTYTHDPKMKYTHEPYWHSAAKRSRWCFLLRSWWLSAGRVPSPPTTSITLRQRQGGEQKTSIGGHAPKKISLVLRSLGGCGYFQGTSHSRVSKFVIITSHTQRGYR